MPGREPQLESGSHPSLDRPSPPLGFSLESAPEDRSHQTATQTEPTFLLAAKGSGTLLEEPQGLKSIWRGVLRYRCGPPGILCPRPQELDRKGGWLSSGRAWCRGKQTARSEGVTRVLEQNLG